jgi:hypothetical protein
VLVGVRQRRAEWIRPEDRGGRQLNQTKADTLVRASTPTANEKQMAIELEKQARKNQVDGAFVGRGLANRGVFVKFSLTRISHGFQSVFGISNVVRGFSPRSAPTC